MRLSDLLSEKTWNDKTVVWENGSYKCVVDDPTDATHVTIWTDDNKKVGSLGTTNKANKIGKSYLFVDYIEISKSHRGNRLGLIMYKSLLKHLSSKWKGIASYQPDAVNKKQVPRIWNKLNAYHPDENPDYLVADKLNEAISSNDKMMLDMANYKLIDTVHVDGLNVYLFEIPEMFRGFVDGCPYQIGLQRGDNDFVMPDSQKIKHEISSSDISMATIIPAFTKLSVDWVKKYKTVAIASSVPRKTRVYKKCVLRYTDLKIKELKFEIPGMGETSYIIMSE